MYLWHITNEEGLDVIPKTFTYSGVVSWIIQAFHLMATVPFCGVFEPLRNTDESFNWPWATSYVYSMCVNYTLKHYLMLWANNRSEPSNIHRMDSEAVLAGFELYRLSVWLPLASLWPVLQRFLKSSKCNKQASACSWPNTRLFLVPCLTEAKFYCLFTVSATFR